MTFSVVVTAVATTVAAVATTVAAVAPVEVAAMTVVAVVVVAAAVVELVDVVADVVGADTVAAAVVVVVAVAGTEVAVVACPEVTAFVLFLAFMAIAKAVNLLAAKLFVDVSFSIEVSTSKPSFFLVIRGFVVSTGFGGLIII